VAGQQQVGGQFVEAVERGERGLAVETGMLAPEADPARLADALWALTGPQLYTQLTTGRNWSTGTYEEWLGAILTATLVPPSPRKR
jgi:hypothetical protein